ncbi:pyridoxamine 5'-phosphate oxidase family protein [Paenactinomyces guangxiensis]|uniref:Pyridoxamine 5'-phosphate oxidase family protein n=2 Tax=Paenactinomyces guangxiensis TaxID=1490290 RepID=A0A7W1WS88_9BACL|nr:pyridoxamine 5'-phosphate oxidase family protein [Paenactinomyces guangxiensis]MBH8592096.1 pyridoxamine 5'-phosphate oxidase family protein [Paenactinomyces guangxiensis]
MHGSHGERQLQRMFGSEKRAAAFYENQMLDHLSPLMQTFIAKQEMMFVATADSQGNCDMSFRAGLPGFIHVVDTKTLIYPEYRGNGVYASLGNIYENPHIGLLFVDFFEHKIGLHVNGGASIIENEGLHMCPGVPEQVAMYLQEKEGGKAERWVLVKVDEAYIHCSKHIPLLRKIDGEVDWGTDDEKQKGGDFFKAKSYKQRCYRPTP